MADNAQTSIGIALGTGALVWAVNQSVNPPLANVRNTPPGNTTLQKSRRTATILSGLMVGLVYWLTKDPVPVIVGGSTVVALDIAHRHADAVHNTTQTVVSTSGGGPSAGADNGSGGIKSSAAAYQSQ